MKPRLSLPDKIAPKSTALLVIDVQNDFCAPDGLLARRGRDLSLMEPMIDRLKSTITTTINASVPVLYTQQIYDRTKLGSLQLEQYDLDGKLVTCDVAGTGYHFYRLTPTAGEIYQKHNYNAFSNPDLVSRLQQDGIKTLVITGVDTQYCVETAIRNGFDLGYKIVVPADLVATSAKHLDMHDRTLELVRKTYGVLTTSGELADIWSHPQRGSRLCYD